MCALVRCTRCGIDKDPQDFFKETRRKNGLHHSCKACCRELDEIRSNSPKKEIITKVCTKCKIERPKEEYCKRADTSDGFRSCCKHCEKEYRKNNPHVVANYREKNKEILKENAKKSRERDRDKINKHKRDKYNSVLKHDINYTTKSGIKSLIRGSIKSASKGKIKKSKRTEEILGCSIEEFKSHIEKQFLNWMSWENYGNYCKGLEFNCSWDLDHIIPITTAKNEEQLYILNHWSNFQPLCSKINRDIKAQNVPLVTNLELNIDSSIYFSK